MTCPSRRAGACAMPEPDQQSSGRSVSEHLYRAVNDFARNPAVAGQLLREIEGSDPNLFYEMAWPLLRSSDLTPGHRYVATLLLKNSAFLDRLCNPDACTREEAVAIARQLARVDPLVDVALARRLVDNYGSVRPNLDARVCERILEILDAVSEGARLVPILSRLVASSNPRLRSKIALLIGRRVRNPKLAGGHLKELDARVRANAVEALWGVDSPEVRAIFQQAVDDPNNRVAGNALYGLYLLDEVTVIPKILALAEHPAACTRTTAAWVMGQTGDPRFVEVLGGMVRDENPAVRSAVFRSLARVKQALNDRLAGGTVKLLRLNTQRMNDGRIRISLAVTSEQGVRLQGLRRTAFVIREGARPVTHFEVNEVPSPELLVVGFALCREPGLSDSEFQAAERGALECLAFKRTADPWLVLKVRPTPEDAVQFSWQGRIEAEVEKSLPEKVPLIASPSVLEKQISGPSCRSPFPSVAAASLESLLAGPVPPRASRHVIVLVDASPVDAERVLELRKAAVVSKTVIHAIQGGQGRDSEVFHNLSHDTGGQFIRASEPHQITSAYRRIYLSCLHRYEVIYTGNPEFDPGHAKVQVYSDRGFGEETA